jgi:BMFP domain-containing protein YqiC
MECIEVPLLVVYRVEKIGGKSSKNPASYLIEIHCKDIRILRLSFLPEKSDRKKAHDLILSMCFPDKVDGIFALSNLEEFAINGWNLYDVDKEFDRQNVFLNDKGQCTWRMCSVNENFKLSDTYPQKFVVPRTVTNEQLMEVSTFRSKGRIPVLSWFNPRNRAAITRSSQPLVGLMRASSAADQSLLEAIYHAAGAEKARKLLIVDMRPRANAVANQAKGAGFENTAQYGWCDIKFMNIENIHVMRDSFRKVMDLCLATGGYDSKWLNNLDSTQWMEHCHIILFTARAIAEAVERDCQSILAHCSDGWDRTSQVVALAMLMLDPYYRTMEGFCVLIEKEWVSFGHRFQTRVAHGQKNWFHDQGCPVFLQFIDAVRQLLLQFPCHFEFLDTYLVELMDQLYSCRFGTFLVDCISDRESLNLTTRSPSVWGYILSPTVIRKHKNPLFVKPRVMQAPENIIYPDVSHARLGFWDRYFLRYCRQMPFSEVFIDGYDYHDRVIQRVHERFSQAKDLEELTTSMTQSNMATITTFQRELHDLQRQLTECKAERDQLKSKLGEVEESSTGDSE